MFIASGTEENLFAPEERHGDSQWTSARWARDIRDGRGYKHVTPNGVNTFTASMPPTLHPALESTRQRDPLSNSTSSRF